MVEDNHSKGELEEVENEVGKGEGVWVEGRKSGETIEASLDRAFRAIDDFQKQKQKKVYSFRLKIETVEGLKKKAAKLGIPYQTLVGTILDQVAM